MPSLITVQCLRENKHSENQGDSSTDRRMPPTTCPSGHFDAQAFGIDFGPQTAYKHRSTGRFGWPSRVLTAASAALEVLTAASAALEAIKIPSGPFGPEGLFGHEGPSWAQRALSGPEGLDGPEGPFRA